MENESTSIQNRRRTPPPSCKAKRDLRASLQRVHLLSLLLTTYTHNTRREGGRDGRAQKGTYPNFAINSLVERGTGRRPPDANTPSAPGSQLSLTMLLTRRGPTSSGECLYKSLQIFSTRGWRYQKRPAEKAVSTALGGPEKGGRERERVLSSTVCPSRPASSAA